jgi:glucokinase
MKNDDDDIQEYVRPWVGLTDEEIKALAAPSDDDAIPMTGRMWVFVGDIEAKLKEKNSG